MNPIPRGTIRIDLTGHVDHLGFIDDNARHEIRAWVEEGSELGVLIDIGSAWSVQDQIVVWLAQATLHALAVDVVGAKPEAVARLVRDLPPAYRLVQSWNEAA